jgi:hypothetical protein
VVGVIVFCCEGDKVLVGFGPLRQLEADTLVAAVATLRELLLLKRVKAELDVAKLDVDDIELRQLPDEMEVVLDMTTSLDVSGGEGGA